MTLFIGDMYTYVQGCKAIVDDDMYLKYFYLKNSIRKTIIFCILCLFGVHEIYFVFCISWKHIKVFYISVLITKD